jgi:hypothetical protein
VGYRLELEEFMDEAEVYGVNGEEIGSVENVLIGEDNRIAAAVVEVGASLMLEILTSPCPGRASVQRPRGDGASRGGQYRRIFAVDADGPMLREDLWKASDVLDDYARVEGETYGYVDDLIFTTTAS